MNKADVFKAIQLCATGGRHANYKRTVEYAKKLRAIITGDSDAVDELMEQFTRRETIEEFNQRKRITRLITPEICNRIEVYFVKGSRGSGIEPIIQNGGKSTEKISAYVDKFYGSQSVKTYLDTELRHFRRKDPNAFIAIEFDPFDPNTQKAAPYPVIYPCDRVYDFAFDKDDLLYVVVSQNESKTVAYFKGGSFLFQRIDKDDATGQTLTPDVEKNTVAYDVFASQGSKDILIKLGDSYFKATEFNNKTATKENEKGSIAAMRVGYMYDEKTDGETCVSHLHPALNRIERTIIANSESDLTHALHVFAQKIQQARPCPGFNDGDNGHIGCMGGFETGTYNVCRNCNGTGNVPVHSSAQDVIYVEQGKGEDQPNLDNIVKYVMPDIETARYLEEFLEKQTEACMKAVFPGSHVSTIADGNAPATATQVQIDYESIFDAIYPYNCKTERLFEFCTETKAAFRDEFITVEYRFPNDLGIQSMSELIGDYKTATDSGAPVEVVNAIRSKIITKVYSDKPDEMLKAKVSMLHEPFANKTKEDIQYITSNNLAPKQELVRWANYDSIISKLAKEHTDFYRMDYEKREELIAGEVKKIMEILNPEQPL